MKNGGKTIVDPATSRAVDNRYHREVLAARAGREQTPAEPRPRLAAAPTARKQPGRRYGPPPAHDPHPRMQAPAPMTTGARFAAYANVKPTLTDRQHRQLYRMGLRRADAKGRPTPKRGAAR